MRMASALLVALVVMACSSHDRADQTPALSAQLADDVVMFCRAWESDGRPTNISALAAYLASHIKSKELLSMFAIPPEGDPDFKKLHALVREAGVTSCPTLDWMETKYARPIPAAPTPSSVVLEISTRGDTTVSD